MDSAANSSFLIRAPKGLLKRLKRKSQELKVSMNQLCIDLLESALRSTSAHGSDSFSLVSGGKFGHLAGLTSDIIEPAFGEALQSVILYGSFARGDCRESSDIDLLIVLDEKFTIDRDTYSKLPDTSIENRPVSFLIVKFPEVPRGIWFNIAIDGVVLFDRTGKGISFLASARQSIINGGMNRKIVHGVPHWVKTDSAQRKIYNHE